jgi:hypothetical protein
MNRRLAIVLIGLALTAGGMLVARAGGILCWIEAAAQDGTLDAQVADLRAKGPAGLAEALENYDALVAQVGERNEEVAPIPGHRDGQEISRGESAIEQMRGVVSQIAGQRDAHISRLYWYTDLAAAQEAAAEGGKPILSLRMLGKLTDEYSCANSRFFRTALYSNREVSDYLRDNFILHWQSVRPVPRITVDFGDGRKLQRTITGNSAHYVLNSTGQPLEVLPGLYGPKAFQEWLVRSKELADRLMLVSNRAYITTLLKEHHANRHNLLEAQLEAELRSHAPELIQVSAAAQNASDPEPELPTARQASFRAVSKSAGETPLLAHVLPSDQILQGQDAVWTRIAVAHADDAKLDAASVELIKKENPALARAAMRAAHSKRLLENPLARMIDSFQSSLAVDTVKNEYLLHRKIHQWFIDGDAPHEVDALNEKVYAELFLTPSSDPWLGLAPKDAYTALHEGGLTAN